MKRRLMNNIGLKILAFFAALLLWLIVVNIDNPVIDKTFSNIPVTVTNEEVLTADPKNPQTYQIVDGTQTVSVTVVGKRKLLNEIKAEDILATADMKELTLKTQIPIDITVNGYEGRYTSAYATPRNLQVKLEKEQGKKFPITPMTTGTVRDGYVLGEIASDPESVFIRGPESVISKISRVAAEVDVSGMSSDAVLKSQLTLYDEDNNEIDQSLLTNNLGSKGVGVSIQLLHTKKVGLEFDTSRISAADGYSFSEITYEPQEIQISGEADALDEITSIQIPASALEVSDVSEKAEKIVDITPYLPDDINLADENTGTIVVSISVEKNGTKSFEMPLGSITVNNLPENLKLTYGVAENIEIQIRGPREILDKLEMGVDITAGIDLKSYKEAGTYEVPVNIQFPSSCSLEQSIKVNVVLEDKE